jgi:hypothetical protein
MKVFDLVSEAYHGFSGHLKDFGKVKRGIDQAIPNARIEPQIRNTDTYMQSRYGIALAAAAAAQDNQFEQESAWAENIGMLAYSEEEIKIIQAADKLMGVTSVALSSKSKERDDIGSASPVADTSWRRK